jgi:DNA mismatch endonuclease (patch repair protein)
MRSALMRSVRSRDTVIEVSLRSMLHRAGFRFRKNVNTLPGKPDIVLPKYRAVVFVHGCFWHQHVGCKKSSRPKTNIDFWNSKLERNVERDKANIKLLEERGWKVLIVWECSFREPQKLLETLKARLASSKDSM